VVFEIFPVLYKIIMITNKQKQVMLSGILGDGSLIKGGGGAMSFSCQHKEYLEFKKELLGYLASEVKERDNNGYKKGTIYTLRCKANDYGKLLLDFSYEDIMKEIDDLGIGMWLADDGSRHKKDNFYNINTHAIDRNIEETVLIPYLNKRNIYPTILTETKKDGRVFSYLYISKWRGGMELSKMIRNLNLSCYDYKAVPIEIEEAYFRHKDLEEFKNKSTQGKTNFIKKYLNIGYKEFMHKNITGINMK
jgi:hypothetical protein